MFKEIICSLFQEMNQNAAEKLIDLLLYRDASDVYDCMFHCRGYLIAG
jgi:hypothetical protein